VAAAAFSQQVAVLVGIAAIMTVGVYGLVAGIVKLDDGGLYLSQKNGQSAIRRWQRSLGAVILRIAPYLMKALSIIGTAAMFMVGGGILLHGIPGAEAFLHAASSFFPGGAFSEVLVTYTLSGIAGIIAGAIVLFIVTMAMGIYKTYIRPSAA